MEFRGESDTVVSLKWIISRAGAIPFSIDPYFEKGDKETEEVWLV